MGLPAWQHAGPQSVVPTTRMNREQFFAKLTTLDEARLKKVLWTMYRRGSAVMRERIEAEIDPVDRDRRACASKAPIDPRWVPGSGIRDPSRPGSSSRAHT